MGLLDSVRSRPLYRSAMPLLAKTLSDEIRPSSVPPAQIRSVMNNATARPQSIPPSRRTPSDSQSTIVQNPLDLMDLLQRSELSVVKTRSGSVLSRGFILKTDHYPSGMCSCLILDTTSDVSCRPRS